VGKYLGPPFPTEHYLLSIKQSWQLRLSKGGPSMSILLRIAQSGWRWAKELVSIVFVSTFLFSIARVAYGGSRQALWLANSVAGQENPSCFLSVNTVAEYLPRALFGQS
jgi:hypothetical protein